MTQQNAALVEQAAAAAESMQGQAEMLVNAVSIFRLETGSSKPAPAIARPATAPRTPRQLPQLQLGTRPELVRVQAENTGNWKKLQRLR
jgi:methyl-accepting chemotaxis protein